MQHPSDGHINCMSNAQILCNNIHNTRLIFKQCSLSLFVHLLPWMETLKGHRSDLWWGEGCGGVRDGGCKL